jgi:hypothetical protein
VAKLTEVFGISASVPTYTYVDRSGLDARFEYILNADRHLVVHGGSKQGKTVLRRKHLRDEQSIVISCGPDDTIATIFSRILAKTNTLAPKSTSSSKSGELLLGGEAGASLDVPFVGKIGGKVKSEGRGQSKTERVEEYLGQSESVDAVIDAVLNSRKRLVIEDFHYLTEAERKKLAFTLKAMFDARVFVIIIGIWAEQNLLLAYNNDLAGRIEEIDVRWADEELRQVVTKGEGALAISIEQFLIDSLTRDASGNVGLLQRLLEGICFEAGVLETQPATRTIGDVELLRKCRDRVCAGVERRYFTFASMVSRGFKDPERTKLKLYRQIVRAAIEACTDDELINGVDREALLAKVQRYEADADLQNLQKALIRIDRLQAERKINPPVVSYAEISRKLMLDDRELLFFRKYNTKPWPWEDNYSTSDHEDDAIA